MACNSEEEVRVSLDQLPRDASDILDILKAEQAPLDLWLVIAREYFKQGKIEQFRQILEEGSSPDIDEYYADVKYERIAILNALGAYYSYLGKIEIKQREKEENFILATQYYNRASRIDKHEPSTWVGKGQLLLARGELEQASASFRIVLDEDRDNVPALLGQACVQFNRKRYSEALELYKRVLRVFPNCPGAVRLGIGLCRYKLGRFEKARVAFQRVLQLEPENVEALVALAVIDLQTNEAVEIRRGMERMQLAFEMYPYCVMALNYLANHFFFTGQHFLVEQLTDTALAGDFEKAVRYYMASVKESNRPHDFVLPYYGLGQVQLKLGDYRSSLLNFEKVLEVYPENCESLKAVGYIYVQLGQTEKALETLRKATRIDPRDAQARNLLKKGGEDVPIELLNNIGVLQFEKGEFKLAEETFEEGLGEGIWHFFLHGEKHNSDVEAAASGFQYKDMSLFNRLEENGLLVEVPWDKVTTIFNYARLLEELHEIEKASIFYRLILFKYPEYLDAYLRLAAIAEARNNIQLSIELVGDALKINDKCPDALSMLGILELKSDDWVKAKDTFRAAREATDGKDSYATLSLGNWNYFAAVRSEKRGLKLEATHLEKAKELYTKVLVQHSSNLYAANGAGIILAEKGHFDVSKDIFAQVQEAASGNIFVQMPDVWINLAHVYFAQGQFASAYQNCLRKFYHNTDTQVLLYLARTHYEAEQWQDCKKTLLRAIHLAPSNYTLRFDAGVAMQKFSASTLQKTKRTADEVRSTVAELKNAVRVFSQLSAASSYHFHGFDEKKIETHVGYCKHLLEAAKVHCEAAEREEQQNRQRMEVARQVSLAEEARRKAEEQRKFQMERRKQEDELKQVMQQEQHFERVKEQWKSSLSASASKRKDRSQTEDDEGGQSEKRRRKGGKRRKRDKNSKAQYEMEEAETNWADEHEEMEEDANRIQEDDGTEHAQDLAAAGLEDSDAEDDMAPSSTANRRKRAWSESDDDEEPSTRHQQRSPTSMDRENSVGLPESDGEIREDESDRPNREVGDDEDED
ncbi:Protein CTR9 [Asimina triloba]